VQQTTDPNATESASFMKEPSPSLSSGDPAGANGTQGTVPTRFDLYRQSNLTMNQLHVWVGQALVPETPIYHLAGALNLSGEIDPKYFERAFLVLINSSDALRTIVEETDGIPFQRVLGEVKYTLDVVDFSYLHEPQATVRSWMEKRCQTPLNLQERLFDSALIKLSAKEFVWYLNVHHLICDGWSFELIYRQTADLYRRCLQGQPLETVPLLPYAHYIVHERAYRESVRYRKAEAYWKQRLVEDGGSISFYGRIPQLATTRTRRVSHQLSPDLAHKLKVAVAETSSEPKKVSLLHIFAAVLIAYIHSLNRKQSYTIGIPFHNRRSKPFKETIGFFSEILPVRIDVAEGDTLASLVGKVREEIQKAVRHGQHSIANPYFGKVYEVVVNYHNRSFSDFAGIPAYPEWIHNGHGDDSLALQIHDFGASGGLVLDFDLHQSIFTQQESEQAVRHCVRALEAFLTRPDQPLQGLTLLSPQETRRVIKEWSQCANEITDRRCVHETLEEQASFNPDNLAVVFKDESLTYQELNRRSNKLAHYLKKRGVGPRTLVALCVERSLDMLVGLFGILKAGAAYVPLDPAYPSDWLKSVLDDIRAPLLLTQRSLLPSLPQERPEAICLDSISETLDHESEANLDSGVTGDDLAYIVYTSGSTGAPKGVEIPHKALANFTNYAGHYFGLQPSDRFLQFAPISFDTAAEEIFPCLTRGATLILRTDSMLESASAFLEKCRDWRVTVLDLPTSYWHELTARLFSEGLVMPDPIRLVIIGGERAIPERLTLWRSCVSKRIRLLNTYGPTETTVATTMCDLTHEEDSDSFTEVPIGRPISNVQTYVLNESLNPVPSGVAGELCISGVGLARGYLNRPDLTAEKFVANPFDPKPGSRLYKTGDLVRYHSHGTLEFLGRIDHQVKIRGFRVELEGIDAVLRKHPLVQDVAVVQDGSSAQRQLIAYLVAKQGANLNQSELKAFTTKKLPAYMIPTLFVVLDSLPLTPNGKVDRKALSLLEVRRDKPAKIHVPPRTHTEKQIARIWAEVLGLERVGRDDHLFELGGHSLIAIQIISRIRKELKVDMPLRAIFEAPTIAEFAQRIEIAKLPALTPGDTALASLAQQRRNIPLSFSQTRIWFMDQLAPESAAYNIVATIRFTGRMEKEALKRSVDEVVRRHESLRTTFRKRGEELIQVATPELVLEIPEMDLRNLSEAARLEEAKRISRQEASRPFDLERGPLIRVLLIRLDEEDQVLILSIHHAICDQWSLGVISREMTSFYSAFCKASTASLETLPLQYSDFALWQGEWLTGPRLETELSYWKRQLADLQPLELPTDHPRPSVQTFHGGHLQLTLSKEMVEGLKKLGVQENATLYMLFLAAFKTLLLRYSGQQDIAIGSPIANRNRIEWEGVVGTFINVLVLRTDLSGKPTFREALRRVRQVVLEAFSHQDLPFEKLVEQLQPKRDPSRPPLFQILFNFHHLHPGKIDLEDLSWVPFEIDTWASQFDISVTVDPEITRKIWVAYNTDLYEANTIARMLGHYQHLLEQIVDNPDRPVETFSILTEPERRQLIHEWNDTKAFYPSLCVHELFEAQARKTPDSVAAVFEGRELSYRDLAQRADQVARQLRSMGVNPDTRVGICMERSLELIIGLLGTLKAGGAYVPIDPVYPSERIAFMVEDSNMRVLLTQEKLLKQIPRNGYQILTIEELRDKTGPEDEESPSPTVTPQNLAYVIYTSGSTGTPKGVEVEHRSLVNFLHSMCDKTQINAKDTFLSVTTISFDIAALELFLPLMVGARIILASREVATDGRRLWEQLEKADVTMMQATPATWRMLLDAGWEGAPCLRILCGGEALSSELAKALLQRSRVLWNLYGPTETTVWSTAWQIDPAYGRISIGRPIANTEVYLLDSNLEPVPAGIAGELYIGGVGLARGYLNYPDLTAEKFISNPFHGDPKARLYRTGDFARYLPDGNIELIGRKDYQIKIRGFRVEPREVEVALCQHPAIRQGVVLAREDVPGDKRLVAYVITHGQQALPTTDLRNFLRSKLPDHMVPSTFVFLDALPLTPNGKVDRRALPAPDQARPELEEIFVAPRTPVEKLLARVWADTLQLDQIGVHDNFFDLGGHSLLATRVISKVRQAFCIELPLLALFENPTVASLAVEVARAQSEGVIGQEMATELSALESLSEEEAQSLLRPKDPKRSRGRNQTRV
jgi:amino acid adenylation domain-containing protein